MSVNPEVAPPAVETPAAAPDVAALLSQLMSLQTEVQSLRAAQPVVNVVPDSFTRAPAYDDTDIEGVPMVVCDVQRGSQVIRHRVKVADWPAYEAANYADLQPA